MKNSENIKLNRRIRIETVGGTTSDLLEGDIESVQDLGRSLVDSHGRQHDFTLILCRDGRECVVSQAFDVICGEIGWDDDDWERLTTAVSSMSHAGDSEIRVLKQLRRSGIDSAIEAIDHIKRLLPKRGKSTRYQWATSLRVALEGTDKRYVSKPHLACALIEMGYGVRYRNSHYFRTDYPCRQVLKEFGRIWRPDYAFC